MKKTNLIKKTLICMTAISMIGSMLSAYAAAPTLNIYTTNERIVTVNPAKYNGLTCSNMGGLSVTSTGSTKRMYVVKSHKDEQEAVLYFFKNYDELDSLNNSKNEYGKIELKGLVGHANGMAIDDNYIYITCWRKEASTHPSRNDIVRISRDRIWSMYKNRSSENLGTLKPGDKGCTVYSAKMRSSSGQLVEFDEEITAITKYKNNAQFIISYKVKEKDENNYTRGRFAYFTIASISNNQLVVSQSATDCFKVDTGLVNSTAQDIGYSPSQGLFIPRLIAAESSGIQVLNKIVWIRLDSLSGSNREYNRNNSRFRYINVSKSENNFELFEVESVSFDNNRELIVSANTAPIGEENEKYIDGVFRIRRKTPVDGSYKFLGSNIDK